MVHSEVSVIYAGSCLDWLHTLEDSSVDHCITDPPYSEQVHATSMRSNTRTSKAKKRDAVGPSKRDLGFESLSPALRDEVAAEVSRVVKRWALIFCDIESAPAWRWAVRGAGLDYVRTCVWIKPNSTPQLTGDRPGQGYEAIVVAHRKGAKRWNGGGRRGVFIHNIDQGGERVHTTEKPVPLMMELVDLFTDRGEMVIDPFAGSATTGIACLRLGRRFAGAELNAAMAETASSRLLAEANGSTLAAQRAGQEALFAARMKSAPPPDSVPMVVE